MTAQILSIAMAALVLAGCSKEPSQSPTSPSPNAPTAAASYYTCPMHPEIKQDQAGKCPKCGMTLVKKEQGE